MAMLFCFAAKPLFYPGPARRASRGCLRLAMLFCPAVGPLLNPVGPLKSGRQLEDVRKEAAPNVRYPCMVSALCAHPEPTFDTSGLTS